ncbi:acid-sensing ion channel 4-A-like [Ixodes scapularis]|uniref:acid-sensing ion channel 4-A-like n=1 Tax=Ixodes scapularis TaxID=6945 RepID=UPI001C38F227|nr:acid-sensing ion channel 4-A-like [Ixodes scapularis]
MNVFCQKNELQKSLLVEHGCILSLGSALRMSGVPGLRVIADARQNPWRRACWLLAFGALACLMVMDLSYIFVEFLRYEDVVSITYTEPARAGFPAVTVCNVNKVRKSVLCQAGAPVGLNDTVFYRWRDLLCNSSNRNIAMSKEDLKLSRELTDWVQVTQSDKRYRGFLLGHKMEDVLQSCVLNGVDCRALNLLDHKSVPSLGSCFCVGCNPGIRYRYPSNRAKQSLNGLHLLLNVQLEEYLPLTVEAGFLIMIHHPWAEEDITQDVTFVAPGSATFISVLMRQLHKPTHTQIQNIRFIMTSNTSASTNSCKVILYGADTLNTSDQLIDHVQSKVPVITSQTIGKTETSLITLQDVPFTIY